MLSRPCSGRLPIPRFAVLGFAVVLAAADLVSIAHAEEAAVLAPATESAHARVELDATLARMTSASRRVREMLREARRRRPKGQITCLDEALSRADIARRSARTQADLALAAYARSELPAARASRARVAELASVQHLAVRDGGKCVPRPVVEKIVPGTVVRVTVDPRIAAIAPEAL